MQDDFGSQLRRARTRKGLDINTVARRLRIRPDVIQAIEDSDFDRMPPRGYARNMINSYAHLLGLNASELTRQYLDEQYAYQVNAARKNTRGTGFDMPGSQRRDTTRQRQANHYEVSGYQQGDLSQPRNARARLRGDERNGRRMYDDYDSGRIMSRSEAERTYRNGGHRSRGRALGEEPIFNAVASPAPSHTFGGHLSNMNLPMLIVIGVVAVLLIVLLVLIFGPKGSSNDSSTMPVASISDVSSSGSSSNAANAPTNFTFSYTVNSGASSWIEVYIDGKQEVAQNVEGPSTKTFTTSGELEFICTDPSGVKAVQDGKDITLTPNSDGVVDIKISFNDVLAAWQRDHGMASSESSSSSSSSSSQSLRGVNSEARAAASTSSSSQKEEDADNENAEENSEDAQQEERSEETAYDEESGYYETGSSSEGSAEFYE